MDRCADQPMRAIRIAKRLGSIVKKDDGVHTFVQINSLVEQVLSLSNSTLVAGAEDAAPIEVIVRLEDSAPEVLADQVQVEQVLLNLIRNAIEAMRELRGRYLKQYPLCPPIIILTGRAEVPIALRAFRQGALDFLQKSFEEFELRDSVQRAITLDAWRRDEQRRRDGLSSRWALLSQAERKVLDLVIEGHPNKKIASTLEVSRRAVEDRRARVMQKLCVESLPDLVKFAVSAGISAPT